MKPVVVVGAGVAGLATALAAAPAPVLLLSRMTGDGASWLAQGGIAAAIDPADSVEAHVCDTLEAGAHHNSVEAVRWVCGEAPTTVAWLAAQGVDFDRDAGGRLALAREGGHHLARVVHAGGDATGAAITRVLQARVREAAHVEWRDDIEVEALLARDGCIAGVRTRNGAGRVEQIEAAAVVFATGGIGALWARTSNPPGANGAGLALALAAGAFSRDLEFMQFHPTALDVLGARQPLLTEALRGAGARIVDGAGHPVMQGVHPLVDLAPRDVVSRREWALMQAGERLWLDASAVQGDWNERFPTVLAACQAYGFDPRHAPLPITPAAHFHMGGLATDLAGRTSLPGLYAVGEVGCNGMHGANRLASNSLLEAVVGGRRVGALLAAPPPLPLAGGAWHWIERGPSLDAEGVRALRTLMWEVAGPVRESTVLRDAWRICRAAAETHWQMQLAKRLLRAMRVRKESLGAHWREDRGCPM